MCDLCVRSKCIQRLIQELNLGGNSGTSEAAKHSKVDKKCSLALVLLLFFCV